ncbi:MAG: PA2169 family four-helix-bundle protein [Saonia sp.]
MSTYTEEVASQLNDLLVKTYDAEKGFKKAAKHAKNSHLRTYFEHKASERNDFGNRLKIEINTYWEEAETCDSLTSKAHRAWMDLKAFFTGDNDEAMLEEAIRGDKAALEEYREVLNDTTALHQSTHQLLIDQKNAIESGLSTIKRLEDLA